MTIRQAMSGTQSNETRKVIKAMSNIPYTTINETHHCKTHADAFEYLISWLKAYENFVTDVSSKINPDGVEWKVSIHAHRGHVESSQESDSIHDLPESHPDY